ncbi:MAG: hypothetical protein JWN00_2579 [Actinomycetia bacterium]|nr:hypothetical protein [Actinomycetes bacterium]
MRSPLRTRNRKQTPVLLDIPDTPDTPSLEQAPEPDVPDTSSLEQAPEPDVPDASAVEDRDLAVVRSPKRGPARVLAEQPGFKPIPKGHRQLQAREPGRPALIAGIVTLAVIVIAVGVTGVYSAISQLQHQTKLTSPLLVYPVAQKTQGQCVAGVQGVNGLDPSGPVCYQVTEGIAIHKVGDIHVQRSKTGYDVSIRLLPADAKTFADLTRRMIGRDLALVVRGRLVTAPRVDMAITGGQIVITGPTTSAAANQLVHDLQGT